jgi:hypothetical protein
MKVALVEAALQQSLNVQVFDRVGPVMPVDTFRKDPEASCIRFSSSERTCGPREAAGRPCGSGRALGRRR